MLPNCVPRHFILTSSSLLIFQNLLFPVVFYILVYKRCKNSTSECFFYFDKIFKWAFFCIYSSAFRQTANDRYVHIHCCRHSFCDDFSNNFYGLVLCILSIAGDAAIFNIIIDFLSATI